jgi:diadenosine tetraphosphate (Ap4A) HIT family hydrolase
MTMTWEAYKEKGIPGRLEAALKGENPTVVTRLESGFVVLSDSQMLPGYCVLLAYPMVESLEALPFAKRLTFLQDMTLLGQAIQEVYKADRINHGIFANYDPFFHAHVWARYAYEVEERRKHPVWVYPWEELYAPEVMFDLAKHNDVKLKLAARLQELVEEHT